MSREQVWSGNPVNWDRWVDYGYQPGMLNRWYLNDNGNFSWVSAGNLNQYMNVGQSTLEYDAQFNLSRYNGYQFNHDAQNRLTSASGLGANMQFVYDGLGRCVKRTVNGATTVVAYDGWKPIVEWNGAGNFQAWNLYGAGADEILWRYQAGFDHLRYHHDIHGNVTSVLAYAGNILEKYTYDAFGKPTILSANNTQRSTSAVGNRFLFTGREWLSELGIYDYRHRMYHPGLGRFLQTDGTANRRSQVERGTESALFTRRLRSGSLHHLRDESLPLLRRRSSG
jgi:RHS repeat-associated protein